MRPDLTIVLDLAPDVAAVRREARGEPAQLYEQNEVQRALAQFYRDLAKHMPNDRIVVVDGHGQRRRGAQRASRGVRRRVQVVISRR